MSPPDLNSAQAMRHAIQEIAVGPDRGRDISRELIAQVMTSVLRGDIDEVQSAVFLIALRMKRESLDEFLGLFDALANTCEQVVATVENVISLADPFNGYLRTVSMTPFIPVVLAANGYSTVMHGVETVGPKHGVTAHKVYARAGIDTHVSVASACERLEIHGWTYIDQAQYAPDLYRLQSLRDRMVKRTALTTLERLLIPIRGRAKTNLVLGYVHKAYPEIYAKVAKRAGYDSMVLLKGVEGGLAPALNKPLRQFYFDAELPLDINAQKQLIELPPVFDSAVAAMPVDDSPDPVQLCLDTGLAVLSGQAGVARDSLSLAAAQIMLCYQSDLSLSSAVEKVQQCLDNGSARRRFDALRQAEP